MNSLGEQAASYQKTILENGLRVVTDTMPQVRSVAIGILVDAGPTVEPAEKAGLAHLTEHVMFHGTSSRDATEIAQLMDVGGGHFGAFTARDYTCYFATVLDDYRTYALDLLGDILLNSIYPVEKLEREKQIILREIAASWDSPYERANMLVKSSTWKGHPLGRSILGTPETVERLTREDTIYFVHENYLPEKIIVAAAGNLDHQDFTAQVRDAFWRLQGEAQKVECAPPEHEAGVQIDHLPLSQVYFCLGMRAYPYAHKDRYLIHLMNVVLGGGISSRLYRKMRDERGLVYHISSAYHAYQAGGMLLIEGSTSAENLNHVMELILSELRAYAAGEKPVTEEELWKAKMHLRGQHLLSTEDSNTRMSRLATQEYYFGRHIAAEEILNEIDRIDSENFNQTTSRILVEALPSTTISVVGPDTPDLYSEGALSKLILQ